MVRKGKWIVQINKDWCKGCGICVAFCPTHVLALQDLKAIVIEPDECTGCRMCTLRCPDLAVDVFDKVEDNAA
jgi:2-oxoglutarate ferredoxin oxidoreductase subunit delta